MRDEPSLPWWLGGGSGDSESSERDSVRPAHGPYPDADTPAPPPPPRYGPDSEWLRDSSALPQAPQHMPPTVGSFGSYVYPESGPPLAELPGPPQARRGGNGSPPRSRRPMSPIASPTPPRARGSGNALRPLLGIFVVLLVVTAGVAIWRANVFGDGSGGFTFPGFGPSPATATPTGYAQSAKISFTRLTQTIASPSSTLVAATNGSGQIKATQQTASASQVSTAAIQATFQDITQVIVTLTVSNNSGTPRKSVGGLSITAADGKTTCTLESLVNPVPANGTSQQKCDEPASKEPAAHWNYTDPSTQLHYSGDSPAGGNAAYYYVPTNCGDASAAQAAARAALEAQLTLPAGAALLSNPTFNIDLTSLTCTPTGGTQLATAFTYVQRINGTAAQTIYVIADAQAYQLAQLKTKIPTSYMLINSSICPNGPVVGTNATATSATLTCTATGTVGWNWTPTALAQLAASVAGASTTTAQLQLNSTHGIVAGSVKITLVNGSQMPQDASAITFAISP